MERQLTIDTSNHGAHCVESSEILAERCVFSSLSRGRQRYQSLWVSPQNGKSFQVTWCHDLGRDKVTYMRPTQKGNLAGVT